MKAVSLDNRNRKKTTVSEEEDSEMDTQDLTKLPFDELHGYTLVQKGHSIRIAHKLRPYK